jgi:hypothetical protein
VFLLSHRFMGADGEADAQDAWLNLHADEWFAAGHPNPPDRMFGEPTVEQEEGEEEGEEERGEGGGIGDGEEGEEGEEDGGEDERRDDEDEDD